MQARSQKFFRTGEFSWHQGTFINIQLQHKKEKPCREKITDFFCLETLKNCISNEKFYPQITTIRAFSPKLGQFFPIFEKGQGRPPTIPRFSYAPDHSELVRKTYFNGILLSNCNNTVAIRPTNKRAQIPGFTINLV